MKLALLAIPGHLDLSPSACVWGILYPLSGKQHSLALMATEIPITFLPVPFAGRE